MTTKPSTTPNRTWTVSVDGRALEKFDAAYFQADGDLTVFKTSSGKAVGAIHTARIVTIRAVDPAAAPASPVAGLVQKIAGQRPDGR